MEIERILGYSLSVISKGTPFLEGKYETRSRGCSEERASDVILLFPIIPYPYYALQYELLDISYECTCRLCTRPAKLRFRSNWISLAASRPRAFARASAQWGTRFSTVGSSAHRDIRTQLQTGWLGTNGVERVIWLAISHDCSLITFDAPWLAGLFKQDQLRRWRQRIVMEDGSLFSWIGVAPCDKIDW